MRSLLRILRHFTSRKHSSFETKALSSLLNKNAINLLDIGAAGGIEPRWKKISRKINYYGFEPDERVRMTNPKTKFSGYHLSPFAVGDSDGYAILNVTKDEGKSSFFFPNQDFLKRFPHPLRFSISKQIELPIKRVDSQDFDDIDFIKIDIQGGELSALKGADGILDEVLGVEVEVEFSKIYTDQPLFGSIYDFLAEREFEFVDFVNLCRWERKSQLGLGQLVFGDALFLKSPEKILFDELSEEKIRKYLAILYLYNRFDLIERVFLGNQNLKISFGAFYRLKTKKMKKLRGINAANSIVTAVYSLFGVEFRSHVIY